MLTINLFTPSFGHSEFSTAFQTTDALQYVRERMEFEGITIFTDGLISSPLVDKVKSPSKIGWILEPPCLQPSVYHAASFPDVYEKFDYILTYYEPLLQHPSGKFRKVIYGGVWIPQSEWGLHPKTKRISMLYGAKRSTRGHQIRHEIAETLGDRYRIDYYGARGQAVDYGWQTKLKVLKDYQYSIITETCKESGLFTELLLDAISVGTIPIYWGDPCIDKFFDPLGILAFRTVQELEMLIRELDEHTYDYLTIFAKDNLRRLPPFRITEGWLYENYFKDLEIPAIP